VGKPAHGKDMLRSRMGDKFRQYRSIQIDTQEPTIQISGNRATLNAWQEYHSPSYSDKGTSILPLRNAATSC